MKSSEARGKSGERAIKSKLIVVLLLIAAGTAYYFHVRTPRPVTDQEVAYVLARKLEVVDTTAEIRLTVATLSAGDRVGVLERTSHWTKVRLAGGKTGWAENKDLLDQETYQREQRLLKELSSLSPQSAGHVTETVNLHLEPSRDAPVLGQLDANQKVDIFGR
ncbi:MAG TPA: SH3 domain-containing protein, partial [Terriglobia bacterium]|nr:SH3 domain-containing protein [Terriglobia bacterium]